MKSISLPWFLSIAFVAVLTAFFASAASQTLGKRRLPGSLTQSQSSVNKLAIAYTKTPMAVSALSFEPLPPDLQQGGIFTSFYGSGYAKVVMTPPDYDVDWEKLALKVKIFPELGQEPYTRMDAAPIVGTDGSLNYWYEYRGPEAAFKGGRIMVSYNKASHSVRAMLAQVVQWRPELNKNVFFGHNAGTFTMRVELWDDDRQLVYFGDALIRLCANVDLSLGAPNTDNYEKMMKTLHHGRYKS